MEKVFTEYTMVVIAISGQIKYRIILELKINKNIPGRKPFFVHK